jgi:tRNA(fMet)-specific endonuclease VapC
VDLTYLLDTNALSEPDKERPNPAFMRRLRQHDGRLATSSVTLHELWYGCQRLATGKRQARIRNYLEQRVGVLPVFPYDERAARWHADERARLTGAGKPPAFEDGQIAAIAVVNDLILVTANESDFVLFTSLRVENWTRP